MKKLAILCFLLAPGAAAAAGGARSLEQADNLFGKGRYAQALENYEAAAKNTDGDDRLRALYRSVECRALAFQYAEAVAAAASLPKTGDPAWQGRLLLLKAEVMREYLNQYGYNLPADIEAGATDVTRRTRTQWEADISAAYAGLWSLKKALAKKPLAQESYFIVSDKTDLRETPTLWDFAALRWGDWILSRNDAPDDKLPDAGDFVKDDFSGRFKSAGLPRAAMAAALYEDAGDTAGKTCRDAAFMWKIKRLMIPFEHGDSVLSKAGSGLARAAIKTLDDWAANDNAGPLARAEALYRSAVMSHGLPELETAVETCKKLEKSYGETNQAVKCAQLRASIEMPSLTLHSFVTPPPGAKALKVDARNVELVHFRIYKTSRAELESLYKAGRNRGGDRFYKFELTADMLRRFLGRKPFRAWADKLKYPARYAPITADVTPPALEKGLYVAAAASDDAFEDGHDLVSGALVNVTELVLIGAEGIKGNPSDYVVEPDKLSAPRTLQPDIVHFYALNGLTGRPAQGAQITALGKTVLKLTADKTGMAAVSQPVAVMPRHSIYATVYPYAQHEGNIAFWQYQMSFGFSPEPTLSLHTETDRPIYRPGQQVTFKVTALERIPQGFRTYAGKNRISVQVRDANWRDIKTFRLQPGSMGGVSGSFEIPADALLGQYHISASLDDYRQDTRNDYLFSVEEYKRPEFEVKLDTPKEAVRYGSPVTVNGAAVYYFGGGVQNAPVNYTVTRQVFIPWWHWRFGGFDRNGEEVASGSAVAGPDGKFSISFTPQPERTGMGFPSVFVVKASARDAGGRTITAAAGITAGSHAYTFDIARDEGFIYADGGHIKVSLQNLNAIAVSGKGTVKFFRLDKRPETGAAAPMWGNFPAPQTMDGLFASIPDGPRVSGGPVEFSESKPADIFFKPPGPGVYRMTLSAPDPWGGVSEQSAIILCADRTDSASLNLPPVTLARRNTVYEGETAEILLGASAARTAPLFVEVWAGRYLLKREMLERGGIRIYRVKTGFEHKGGITVRWFAAKDFKFLSGRTNVTVPWRDKNLNVKFQYTKTNEPGGKANWAVSVADWRNRPVNAQASVRVYDRSLEYYEAAAPSWIGGLYPKREYSGGNSVSIFAPYNTELPVRKGWIELMMQAFRRRLAEPVPPYIQIAGSRHGRSKGMFLSKSSMMGRNVMEDAVGGAMLEEGAVMGRASGAPSAMTELKKDKAPGMAAQEASPSAAQPEIAPRTNFAETAYFNPFVGIRQGKGGFSFTLPQRLTSWKLSATVITRDIKTGAASAEAVTAKPVMARVLTPRFWREGDRSEIRLTVTNTTAEPVSGEAAIKITENMKNVTAAYTETPPETAGTVPPGESKTFIWPVRVAQGIASLKITGGFRAGAVSDSEQQELPVLPGYDRVLRSVVKLLDRDSETLAIEDLPQDAFMENAFVQVDPQLASAVMNSLPQLVLYPYECTEQVVNRAVPLAVTDRLYRQIPGLRESVARIPKRKTISPEWERDNPLRQMGLEETPWFQRSKGGESLFPLIDLLKPELVSREYAASVEKLRTCQKPDGSFPWFPGGESNLYMTLYVLDAFATAGIYGVEIPQDILRNAMRYAVNEIPKHMDPDTSSLAFVLYGAYTLTSYPAGWSETQTARRYAKTWMEYVDRHSDALTQLGEAHAAWIYLRLGDKKKSDEYLDRAVDGAKTGAEGSVCWTPEKISWFWYSDTLETHAFLLRTLLNLRPGSKLIKGMALWMMPDRKTAEWKSTKAAAAAVYSLLEYMKKTGMLSGSTNYRLNWGAVKAEATVAASDFLQKPLRWELAGPAIKRANSKAVIEKTGKGMAFATLSMVYTTRQPVKASKNGMLAVDRQYFLRRKTGRDYTLSPLDDGATVKVGDELEVHLTINARHQFEFVHLADPKGAGFEFETLKSGWEWDRLARYTEPRDSRMNFFASWLPHGEYVLAYRLRPTTPGVYHIGPAALQSMYAPEFAANSASVNLTVTE
ncbi:MAG: MG2 domain-containing protein [Elusimicrobiaceae bacterium]|nr:MG2 domain-containing protein [Elusimicrobiaceae bacterium]